MKNIQMRKAAIGGFIGDACQDHSKAKKRMEKSMMEVVPEEVVELVKDKIPTGTEQNRLDPA